MAAGLVVGLLGCRVKRQFGPGRKSHDVRCGSFQKNRQIIEWTNRSFSLGSFHLSSSTARLFEAIHWPSLWSIFFTTRPLRYEWLMSSFCCRSSWFCCCFIEFCFEKKEKVERKRMKESPRWHRSYEDDKKGGDVKSKRWRGTEYRGEKERKKGEREEKRREEKDRKRGRRERKARREERWKVGRWRE